MFLYIIYYFLPWHKIYAYCLNFKSACNSLEVNRRMQFSKKVLSVSFTLNKKSQRVAHALAKRSI